MHTSGSSKDWFLERRRKRCTPATSNPQSSKGTFSLQVFSSERNKNKAEEWLQEAPFRRTMDCLQPAKRLGDIIQLGKFMPIRRGFPRPDMSSARVSHRAGKEVGGHLTAREAQRLACPSDQDFLDLTCHPQGSLIELVFQTTTQKSTTIYTGLPACQTICHLDVEGQCPAVDI